MQRLATLRGNWLGNFHSFIHSFISIIAVPEIGTPAPPADGTSASASAASAAGHVPREFHDAFPTISLAAEGETDADAVPTPFSVSPDNNNNNKKKKTR